MSIERIIIIKKTFDFQDELPRLPIPSLISTKSNLIEWIKPLVNNQKFKKTTDVIDRFFEENGEAEKLQKKLLEWDQNKNESWLTPFWDELYLKHREGLPYSTNFNILVKGNQYKKHDSMSELAGKVGFLVTELYHEIIDGKLEPSMFRGKPLDMGQYKKFFRSIRIPRMERDVFRVADFDKKNNHVVILYQNNVYKVQVSDHEGLIYQNNDITAAIETIFREENDEGINVGIFTTAERDLASQAYDQLKLSEVNAEVLQTIADSLVVISIDEDSKNSEEAIRNLMLNDTNKYFDKTIQIVITKYGELGYNIEHSAVDGTSISTVISYISKGLAKNLPQGNHSAPKNLVEKKDWELTEEIQDMLAQLQKDHSQKKNDYFLLSKTFTDFGAEKIKGLKISPDAFFHMALQIAQYRTYGEFNSVYEPVSVRVFFEGRTECARATSMEKSNLVEAIENGGQDHETLYALIQTASNAHSERIRDCQKGFGVERHLYGLEQMYNLFGSDLSLEELPEFFLDEGYKKLRHDFISTSGMAYEDAKYRMFAPVTRDGHGVAYFILEDSISINISSFKDNKVNGNQLMQHMLEALKELKGIAERGKDLNQSI